MSQKMVAKKGISSKTVLHLNSGFKCPNHVFFLHVHRPRRQASFAQAPDLCSFQGLGKALLLLTLSRFPGLVAWLKPIGKPSEKHRFFQVRWRVPEMGGTINESCIFDWDFPPYTIYLGYPQITGNPQVLLFAGELPISSMRCSVATMFSP